MNDLIKNFNKKLNCKKTSYTVEFVCKDDEDNNHHCTVTVEKSVYYIGNSSQINVRFIWHNFISIKPNIKDEVEKEIKKLLKLGTRKKTSA